MFSLEQNFMILSSSAGKQTENDAWKFNQICPELLLCLNWHLKWIAFSE